MPQSGVGCRFGQCRICGMPEISPTLEDEVTPDFAYKVVLVESRFCITAS